MHVKHLNILISSAMIALMSCFASCSPDWNDELMPMTPSEENQEIPGSGDNEGGNSTDRGTNRDTRKVLLLYSAGFNSLSSYLKEDIEELSGGWLPSQRRADDLLLVYSHLPVSKGEYSVKTSPVLFRMYSRTDGTVIRDTLVRYEPGTISSSAGQLNEVLSYVKDNFPAKSYGLLVSSHATGYLPNGFYRMPDKYTFSEGMMHSHGSRRHRMSVPVPYVEPEHDPGMPEVKSIGEDVADGMSHEMDIRDFAEAIPMKLEYILFDACLMGGVEVAYELAGKCDKIGFSQAEVLAEGFNYSTLSSHLLGNRQESDPQSVCEDYFSQYEIQTGVMQSATISMVDCGKMENLASLCKGMFEKYSDKLSSMKPGNVQRFYRSSHHWFYDLESILANAGISESELESLHKALDECIIYKGATPKFMNEFTISTFCGLSMYLPSNGHSELDKYYKTLKWNKATGLVK